MANWKNTNAGTINDPNKLGGDLLRPNTSRGGSVVSKLSSDTETDLEMESDGSGSDQMVACKMCGGKDFRAKKVSGRGQMLVCGKCGTVAE